ncbi:hydrolase [Vibrio sp. HA2012]|uniref:endonuclease/exonuclease/phosphatase family protein n=1 Tax=Vibrio sp. HA2012 TaxID=1971595 RepID=UPI000C2CDD41|nr:endonuclease/exonuclease/phosphatase family protein [Vibrio sp. HA2012]PJC87433.1 hydrolase [Vibrio sp. HA2012]
MKKNPCLIAIFMLIFTWSNNIHAKQILFTSWNLEWLTNNPQNDIAASKRTTDDFLKLAEQINRIRPDILAFQEVDNNETLKQIINSHYKIYLSDRNKLTNRHLQFDDINQYTGFAVSDKWEISDPEDVLLSPGKKLRFASYIILHHPSMSSIHLLSVHLKAGCRGKNSHSYSCKQLKEQGNYLNVWIRKRLSLNQHFIILGDFNHNLAYPEDWFWKEIIQGTEIRSKPQVILATRHSTADCLVRSKKKPGEIYRYPYLIDHIVTSSGMTHSQPIQNLYTKEQVLRYTLSDHCPLSMSIEVN